MRTSQPTTPLSVRLRPLHAAILLSCLPVTPTSTFAQDTTAVQVDRLVLTDVNEQVTTGLNLSVVVSDSNTELARGIQKAADVWGLHADLFLASDSTAAENLLRQLAANAPTAIITDQPVPADITAIPVVSVAANTFSAGFGAVRTARARVLSQIPKYEELFNISFPISPLPDSFFQPTKFPYPDPLIRSVRTVSSSSASAHAHTSCPAVALLGNMIHRTSAQDPEVFLLGFEGGNVSVKAEPGAVTNDKLSAVMTSFVFGFRGPTGGRRHVLSENDGLETSVFTPAIHATEEFARALATWQDQGAITTFQLVDNDRVLLGDFEGADRLFRASLFMVSSDRELDTPDLSVGIDGLGRWVFEFTSTQGFVQAFGEIPRHIADTDTATTSIRHLLQDLSLAPMAAYRRIVSNGTLRLGDPLRPLATQPIGGMLTEAGALPGLTVGLPLGSVLHRVADAAPRFPPYILALDGGFLSVTPEVPLSDSDLAASITRIDIDERGPLGSDQEVVISLSTGTRRMFRRTVFNFGYVDTALTALRDQAWISGWEYVGARGRGLAANVVLYNLLGKNRKFMSSLNTWPSNDRPSEPYLRWYVDGMQRLNFSIVSPEGWRQEFVEVPLRVPPIPRDVQLYSGVSTLD